MPVRRLAANGGKIAILSASIEAHERNNRIVGMNDTLASGPKYAKVALVATVHGDDQPE